MENQNQRLDILLLKEFNQTAVFRTVWFVVTTAVVVLLAMATPLRYEMLRSDIYNYEAGLQALGLSLTFFAIYFVSWELVVIVGSLLVAGLIVWQRADDWFAMLVALGFTLFGLVPPLIDGLQFANPKWAFPISALRLMIMGILMAVFCLFPNGRFQPKWTRWLLISWAVFSIGILMRSPLMLADTAVLPNTRSWQDAIWLLISVAWFSVAIAGQVVRYRRHATPLEKQQMKWVLFGFAILVFFSIISALLLINNPNINNSAVNRVLFTLVAGGLYLLLALALPAAMALSILRYRLWDVDILLNRTLVYGGLTALITAVYILLVGGIGTLAVGSQSNGAAVVVATAVVMLGIRPLHRWLDSKVNHLIPVQKTVFYPHKNSQPVLVKQLRIGWIINLLLVSILFVMGIIEQAKLGSFLHPAEISQFSDLAISRLLNENIFITHPDFGVWVLLASYGQAVIFAGVGLYIFKRKSNDVMGIVASWMFLSVGIGFTPAIVGLPVLAAIWHIPVTVFQIGMFGSIILFLTLFPNGRFYPKQSKLLFIVWFIFMLLWIPFPQLNLHRSTAIWPAFTFVLVVIVGIIAQLFRYRLIFNEVQKQQTKWVIFGFIFANSGLLGIGILTQFDLLLTTTFHLLGFLFLALAPVVIPITITIALLRYRLWQIDILINRTLVYGGLTAIILLTYTLLVGGFSLLWRSQNNLIISLLATGLIAVLFQPIRERLQRAANRLMFGDRDDPYGVLSKLGVQLQTTATPEATLQSVVQTIANTLKLPYVAVKLADEQGALGGAATGKAVTDTIELPLRYQNEPVGNLVVSPRSPGESFTAHEQQLLNHLAAQAGAMAYSVRLTAALQRSATALQQSREKLVLTREEERRRIRRDLHDGLGPTLASQTFALDTALDLLETDPQAAADLLQSLKSQNQKTVADIRRLVYELRPPTLDELGVVGALQAHIAQLNSSHPLQIQVTTIPDPLPALSAAVEVAAYRIVLEAITNVVRHAQAKQCYVSLCVETGSRSQLRIEVSDDGIGLPANLQSGLGLHSMRERAEELGGGLVMKNEGGGMDVTAVLPLSNPKEGFIYHG
ncbi:histidine kinase [Candidatus Leptofilum sp.]|uniref:sensor histidine kinase n=1 Tax=Candidatus Leptofilum sp. TaxID=3241576 RepID=UPI003B5B38D5